MATNEAHLWRGRFGLETLAAIPGFQLARKGSKGSKGGTRETWRESGKKGGKN